MNGGTVAVAAAAAAPNTPVFLRKKCLVSAGGCLFSEGVSKRAEQTVS